MISGIYLLSSRGDVLISRNFRDDLSPTTPDAFRINVIGAKDVRSPITQLGELTFLHVQKNTVWVVAVTKSNINAGLAFETLHQLITVFKSYFNGTFDEDSIRQNFALIYELLDEIIDFGYPQTTDPDTLKVYITQAGKKRDKKKDAEQISKMTRQVTGDIPWREPDLKYRKNELFIDVVESVNLLVSAKGNVLRSDVSGQVLMKCFLSGMPECKFGMNDKLMMDKEGASRARRGRRTQTIVLDDVNFHQCVRLGKFDHDRTITFTPPDGSFELMKYRITENINLPFRILPIVKEVGRTRVETQVTVKAAFSDKLVGQQVIIKVPCPKNTALCKIHVGIGKARYQPTQDCIVWRIKKFPGDAEFSLSADIELSASVSVRKAWSRPPISMQFTVPMFTASGLHVRFLKVVESKLHYQTIKWVRYVTRAGQYQIRI